MRWSRHSRYGAGIEASGTHEGRRAYVESREEAAALGADAWDLRFETSELGVIHGVRTTGHKRVTIVHLHRRVRRERSERARNTWGACTTAEGARKESWIPPRTGETGTYTPVRTRHRTGRHLWCHKGMREWTKVRGSRCYLTLILRTRGGTESPPAEGRGACPSTHRRAP